VLAEIPLHGLWMSPQRTDALVGRVDRWFSANSRRIAIVLCACEGIFLIARGSTNA
jgi:Protein of unknown function (DUF2910).